MALGLSLTSNRDGRSGAHVSTTLKGGTEQACGGADEPQEAIASKGETSETDSDVADRHFVPKFELEFYG